jgi:hypothetical protein
VLAPGAAYAAAACFRCCLSAAACFRCCLSAAACFRCCLSVTDVVSISSWTYLPQVNSTPVPSQSSESQRSASVVWVGTSKGLIRTFDAETHERMNTLAGHTGERCTVLVFCAVQYSCSVRCSIRVLCGAVFVFCATGGVYCMQQARNSIFSGSNDFLVSIEANCMLFVEICDTDDLLAGDRMGRKYQRNHAANHGSLQWRAVPVCGARLSALWQ